MKALGMFLIIVGVLVALFMSLLVGAIVIAAGALVLLASGQGKKPEATAVCAACGNLVPPTANLCPVCRAALVPTEGPLIPTPGKAEYVGRRMVCVECGQAGGIHLTRCSKWGKPK